MITEDYVNKQIALLLREKGFDEPTLYHYNGDNKEPTHTINYDLLKNSELKEFCSAAPTVQMVLKWLREVHHYYIQVMLDSWALGSHSGYYVVIQKTDSDFEMMLQDAIDEVFYQTYEEACEAAIEYCLTNLI